MRLSRSDMRLVRCALDLAVASEHELIDAYAEVNDANGEETKRQARELIDRFEALKVRLLTNLKK